jgi:ADP-heptose:LPS heptosyltransferase
MLWHLLNVDRRSSLARRREPALFYRGFFEGKAAASPHEHNGQMKILVIKRDKIGDLLLTTPMLAHLKASLPGAEVHLLANDYNSWVVAGNPNLDRLWTYRRVRQAGRFSLAAAWGQARQYFDLRRQGYDAAIVANGEESPRAIQRALYAGARRTIAYCGARRYRGLTDPLPSPGGMHECDRLLALLAPLGIAAPARALLPQYHPPPEQEAFARNWLRERGLSPRGYVALGLGARRKKKQPAPDQVLRWSERFKRELGLDTVFMWTPGKSTSALYPGDDDLAQPVLEAALPHIHPFRGPLLPAIGLIWDARGSIFPDSGLMHFAAASPGGVLGLFAETDVSPNPRQWGPRGAHADYLEAAKSVAELPDELVFSRFDALLS